MKLIEFYKNIVWKIIPSYPMYEVSEFGAVRSIVNGKILTQRPNLGYVCVSVKNCHGTKSVNVHRLVCEAFHGEKPSPIHQVAHWDGKKNHNHHSNLRWATPKENRLDRVRHEAATRIKRTRPNYLCPRQKNLPQPNP